MNSQTNAWGLEIVRGREVGRVFPLGPGASVLGNAPGDVAAVDLGSQEGTSPRRMAARQARVVCSRDGLSLVDLESPGGTFVNRQRLLPGQDRSLQPGDVIQLGAVQLRVVESRPASNGAAAPPSSATATKGGPLPSPFRLESGATCRTWDDFLTVSSQKWSALRDELTSGRLGSFLSGIGRSDLKPQASSTASPDERLDEWLGRLPTSKPALADSEVHPEVIRVRAVAGGGSTRRAIVLTNTGYRLLRSTVRVDGAGADWIAIPPEFSGKPFLTAEQTEIPLEVIMPESVARPLVAWLRVEGNGGLKRVEVRLEPAAKAEEPVSLSPAGSPRLIARSLGAFAGLPTGRRVALGAAGAALFRGVLVAGDLVATAGSARPSLGGSAILIGVAAGAAAAVWAVRRGESGSAPVAGFAGAVGGVFLAAAGVAFARTVEPLFGGLAATGVVACGLWALLGAAAGGVLRGKTAAAGSGEVGS